MQSLLVVVFFFGGNWCWKFINDISWFSAVDRISLDRWFHEIFWEYMGWISKLEPQSTWETIHWYLGNHGFEMTLDTLLSRFAPWAGPSRSRRGVQGEVSTKLRLGPRGFGFCSEPAIWIFVWRIGVKKNTSHKKVVAVRKDNQNSQAFSQATSLDWVAGPERRD